MDCNGRWIGENIDHSAYELTISLGDCPDSGPEPDTTDTLSEDETVQNLDALCIDGTLSVMDGTYQSNGTFNDHVLYQKAYQPQFREPWVYMKFEETKPYHDDGVYGWTVYRALDTQNFYFFCDPEWANEFYSELSHDLHEDPSLCNEHWIHHDFGERNDITVTMGTCDNRNGDNEGDTKGHGSSSGTHCRSEALSGEIKPDETYYDEVCLDHIGDETLDGIYVLNGTYNGFPGLHEGHDFHFEKSFL